jgi:hypothetical protein
MMDFPTPARLAAQQVLGPAVPLGARIAPPAFPTWSNCLTFDVAGWRAGVAGHVLLKNPFRRAVFAFTGAVPAA